MLKFYLEESKNVTAQNEIVPTEHFESKFLSFLFDFNLKILACLDYTYKSNTI